MIKYLPRKLKTFDEKKKYPSIFDMQNIFTFAVKFARTRNLIFINVKILCIYETNSKLHFRAYYPEQIFSKANGIQYSLLYF